MKLHQLLKKVIIWDINEVTSQEVNECLLKEDSQMVIYRDLTDQIKLYEEESK